MRYQIKKRRYTAGRKYMARGKLHSNQTIHGTVNPAHWSLQTKNQENIVLR